MSTYFHQVYDDNRWWISRYQTLEREEQPHDLRRHLYCQTQPFRFDISSDGEILIEPFQFSNDADGFQMLVSKLDSFDKSSIIIGLESTAHYGDNLVRYLVASLYKVYVINPIQTSTL